MDIETLNLMHQDLYRAAVLLIEGITLIFGLASALFVPVCAVGAACDFFAEI